jgi:hypothetical protein
MLLISIFFSTFVIEDFAGFAMKKVVAIGSLVHVLGCIDSKQGNIVSKPPKSTRKPVFFEIALECGGEPTTWGPEQKFASDNVP